MSDSLSKQVGGDHYRKMVIQPIEFCQRNKLGAAESLAIKYICRHRDKNGRVDIEKAIHCLQLLLDIEYPLNPLNPLEPNPVDPNPDFDFDYKTPLSRTIYEKVSSSYKQVSPPIARGCFK